MQKNKTKDAVINIKVDANLKDEATRLAQTLGVPLSLVIAGGLRQFVVKQGISFFTLKSELGKSVSAKLQPSAYLEEAITEARRERARGEQYSFSSAQEAVSFLNSLGKSKKKAKAKI